MTTEDPVAAFRLEAADVLDEVEQALLDLGGRLDDMGLVNAVFRGFHTVKGSGAMFGFDALASFTHHCETAFDKVRKGQVPLTADLISAILEACDHMRHLLADGDERAWPAGNAILARLAMAQTQPTQAQPTQAQPTDAQPTQDPHAAQAEPQAAPSQAEPTLAGTGWRMRMRLAPNATVNGTNPLALLAELHELGEVQICALTDRLPPLAELDPTECHIGWDVTLKGAITRDQIEDVFLFVLDDMDLELAPLAPAPVSAPAPAPDAATPPATVADPAPPPPPAAESTAARPSERPADETVRVPAARLDEMMNRVGELVIAQSRLSQLAGASPDMALRSIAEEIDRLATDLRTTMMVLRMVPVANLFGRFRRLVHDLGRETGKGIALVTEGEGTEVDKTVAEALFDPLVHLIRNACDHGIEDAAQRLAQGKPEVARVRLSAHQAGGQVVLTIADDGQGIDLARVRARAQAIGLIEPGAVVSDHDLTQMIFQPGFSTAAKVTSLSGRGVGMDVVKRKIEALRGTIEVATAPGQGTTITLHIPLTLAIIEGLLVRVGHGHFVLPLGAVEECLELSAQDDRRASGRNLMSLRDRLVPFLRLRDMFAAGGEPDPFQKVVVVANGDARVGLVVDQIVGSQQTVIKSMSPLHRNAAAFAGATILGDGSVALILDVGQLLGGQLQPPASPPATPPVPPHPPFAPEERLRAVG